MRKSTIEKMEEHIHQVKKIPKDIKKQNRKKIFLNLIVCIIFILYIVAIIIGKSVFQEGTFLICYKIASLATLLATIILFEVAYKIDNGYVALYGIETLVIALITLFSKNILKTGIPNWFKFFGLIILTYYLIKCLIIYKKEKNAYLREQNDLQEIIKKESQDKLKPIMEQKNKENIAIEKSKKKTNSEKKTSTTTKKKKEEETKTNTKKQVKNNDKKTPKSSKKEKTTRKETTNKKTNKKEKK